MKQDWEIKKFIDENEVLTQSELRIFMYGYRNGKFPTRFLEWWTYVLETKDWVKMKQHKENKINHRKESFC